MKVKVADYVINRLAELGIKEIFVVYGAANGDLIDAFTRTDKTRYICTMHEQAAGFAAEGYARVSGKFGVAIATSGPGGHNLVTPIGNCYYESVPALFITGQQNTKFMKKTKRIRQNAFQETEIVDIVRPITKYSVMVKEARNIRYELEKALHYMSYGRPGPVLLDIPMNIQKEEVEPGTLDGFVPFHYAAERDGQFELEKFVAEFAEDLKQAKRPAIMVGGGVKLAGCCPELRELLRKIGVPVFPTWNALDTIPSDFEFYGGRIGTYGGDGRNFGIQNSDLLLCIATRVSGRITAGVPSSFARGAKKYIVDIDAEILKDGQHDVVFDRKLCCDVGLFIAEMNAAQWPANFDDWCTRVLAWRYKYPAVDRNYYLQKGFVHPYVFVEMLGKALSPKDIIITDCGGNLVVTNHALPTKTGQKVFSSNGNSPMGFSMCGAIGAWFAAPKGSRVVCIIGDGGMNMNIQELQTLVNYGISIKVIILNNGIYGITKAYQKTNFNGRAEACGPKGYVPPDFRRVVEAYGIGFMEVSVNDPGEIGTTLDEFLAVSTDVPVVLNVNCKEYHRYVPRVVGWDTPIEDMYPYLSRPDFRRNMIIEPVPNWEHTTLPAVEV